MNFTDKELSEYQEIIRQESGECISTDEAKEQTESLYQLFKIINRYENGNRNTPSH